ncbi:MAG: hypothetical protein L6V87_04415 [Ruminococcus sp.]|nr:MAG: hypothetical protein L6V87_04415 [Ruminococcus sp.]
MERLLLTEKNRSSETVRAAIKSLLFKLEGKSTDTVYVAEAAIDAL